MAEDGGRVPMSPGLQATLLRAREYAASQNEAQVLLEHLLLALSEDGDAATVLEASQVDLSRLRHDVAGYLGSLDDRVPPGTAGAPAISPALTQVLKYATLAAQQGRRSSIDGAIVLAALVGDGRSMAASLLKSQGLTFEAAIRALRDVAARASPQAGSRSSSHPAAPAHTTEATPISAPAMDAPIAVSPSNADLILARARERVEHRTQRPEVPAEPQGSEAPPGGAPQPAGQSSEAERAQVDVAPEPRPAPVEPDVRSPAFPAATAESQASRSEPQTAPTPPPAPARPPELPPSVPVQPPPPRRVAPQLRPPHPPQRQDPGHLEANGAALPSLARPPAPISRAKDSVDDTERDRRMPAPHADARQWNGFPTASDHSNGPGVTAPPPDPGRGEPGLQANLGDPRRSDPSAGGSFLRSTPIDRSLVSHSIPPRMSRGRASVIEVIIDRPPLSTGGAPNRSHALRAESVVARAIAVRLRPSRGRFIIEASSPETQWDQANATSEPRFAGEPAVWRFTVTPLSSGNGTLQLAISARTLGADGILAETQLPDEAIRIRIGQSWTGPVGRIGLYLAVAAGSMIGLKLLEGLLRFDLFFFLKQMLRL